MFSPNGRSFIAEFLPDLCKFCTSLQSTGKERKVSRISSRLEATRFGSNLTEIRYFRCLFLRLTNSRIQFNDCGTCAIPIPNPSPPRKLGSGELSIRKSLPRLVK
jgi:hypothetical protein